MKKLRLKKLRWAGMAFLGVFLGTAANAAMHRLPQSLAQDALSESADPIPRVLAPADIGVADFTVEWLGAPIEGVRFSLGKASLQWVKAAEVISVPRARLLFQADGVEAGLVSNQGFHQALAVESGSGTAELPVALISGPENRVEIVLRRSGRELRGALQFRFKPRDSLPAPRIYTDSGCSPYRVTAESKGQSPEEWMYVGCRLVRSEGDRHATPSLELYVYWDGVGQSVEVSGVSTPATLPSLWALRMRSQPGHIELKAGAHEVRLNYSIPEKLNFGFLGLGVGPYAYAVSSPGVEVNSLVPLLTFYGSYFITEGMRLVVFDAVAVHREYFNDLGVYLNSESLNVLDRRLSMNLMLGAHVLAFRYKGQNEFRFSGPQGVEFVFRDALKKGHNFALGSFIYPPINGTSYYNVWVRWGSGSTFAELNYIGWQESFNERTERIYSRSVGVSVGFPIARFF